MNANHCMCYIVCMCVGMFACNHTCLVTQPEIISETLVIFDIASMNKLQILKYSFLLNLLFFSIYLFTYLFICLFISLLIHFFILVLYFLNVYLCIFYFICFKTQNNRRQNLRKGVHFFS